jgi:membrane protease YdiL (CAAX protease family)
MFSARGVPARSTFFESTGDCAMELKDKTNSAQSPAATLPRARGSEAGDAPSGWRASAWLALAELAAIVLVFLADHFHLVPLSRTPFLLAIGWVSLRIRRVRWSEVGFRRYRSWAFRLSLGIGGGLALELFQLFVTQPLLTRLTRQPPDLSDFLVLQGNRKYSLIALGFAWTLAAFGEELVWRGYLMNRVAGLLQNTRAAWISSLLVVNVAFGYAHSYQGITGMVEEGLAGIFLGLMYLGTGRNLAVPIVAHGVSDTLDVLLLFLGKMPGT